MKKRMIALLLAALLVPSLTACGSSVEESATPTTPPATEATQPLTEAPPATEPVTEPPTEAPTELTPAAPAFAEALAVVEGESVEAQSMLAGGFTPVDNDETVLLHGDLCRRVELYRDADGYESHSHFAVSPLGALYYAPDPDSGEWIPFNGAAMAFAGAGEDDLFLVCTDDWASEYECFLQKAEFVSTPVVGLEMPKPIVVVALKDGVRLRVELDFEPAPDVFYDDVMARGQALAVSAALSAENSDLRIVAEWQGKQAVWYADSQNGVFDYTAYIPGE